MLIEAVGVVAFYNEGLVPSTLSKNTALNRPLAGGRHHATFSSNSLKYIYDFVNSPAVGKLMLRYKRISAEWLSPVEAVSMWTDNRLPN